MSHRPYVCVFALVVCVEAMASPTSGPGPYQGTLDVQFADESVDLSVDVDLGVSNPITLPLDFPVSLSGTTDVEITKTSPDSVNYTGVGSLQFLGGNLSLADTSGSADLSGLLFVNTTLNYQFTNVTGSLSSSVLAVDDPDYDGEGTFDATGTVVSLNSGTITATITGGITILIYPPPSLTIDLSAHPFHIMFEPGSTGTIVDLPGGVTTISIDDIVASAFIEDLITITSGGQTLGVGATNLDATVGLGGGLVASGTVVPELGSGFLAGLGLMASICLGCRWRSRRRPL